jgi:hypothetical protein
MQVSATRVSVGWRRARGGDEQVEQCADGAAASRTTAPGSQAQAQASRRPGPSGRARWRDDGWILVTVVSTSRLPVVAEMSRAPDLSQLRLPAPGEQRASRQQNRRGGALARADGQCQVASRLAAGVESTESGRRGSGHRARAASCACACSMRSGLARAAAGPTDSCAACVAGGTPVDGGLVSLGCEEVGDEVDRRVDRLARVLVYRGASIVMRALGRWCACGD